MTTTYTGTFDKSYSFFGGWTTVIVENVHESILVTSACPNLTYKSLQLVTGKWDPAITTLSPPV